MLEDLSMRDNSTLRKYSVKLAIVNVNETEDPNFVQDLTEEIAMRPHLQLIAISQDVSSHRLIVDLSLESLNQELAAKQITEELFEITNAILTYIKSVRIDVLSVTN